MNTGRNLRRTAEGEEADPKMGSLSSHTGAHTVHAAHAAARGARVLRVSGRRRLPVLPERPGARASESRPRVSAERPADRLRDGEGLRVGGSGEQG